MSGLYPHERHLRSRRNAPRMTACSTPMVGEPYLSGAVPRATIVAPPPQALGPWAAPSSEDKLDATPSFGPTPRTHVPLRLIEFL